MENAIRNLKIKAASCKRIVKELHSYEKEVERESAKTNDMKNRNADPYDLKQQENVLAESRMMIPDCHKRLDTALADLKAYLVELKDDKAPDEVVKEAQDVIAEVERLLPQSKPNQEGTEVEEAGEV
ncbi:hypothetical protein DM860_016621 [Cuscuta australis]|uniref:Tubulin-specific chaperone A n=1 Tax=Cuscuta australis TaxID=267555 RepID=A0A328DNG4_9ASTE|nr:hypothetical protein DM860_016621 [Cuscuta australis]